MAENCQICKKVPLRYTCPKCNIPYCSVDCYRAPAHLHCSEEFYKDCIQEELTSSVPNSQEDMSKIYEILKRMRETDAGIEPEDFDDGLAEPLDSDDDQAEDDGCDSDDMATRLQGLDIDDADEVWARLTAEERRDFQKTIESGEIFKLLPEYKPWWEKKPNSKIVELPPTPNANDATSPMPRIAEDIPPFSSICKKVPSPCVHFNLWNLITAYSCTVRFFSGEHLLSASEAAAHLVNLCSTLKYGTNFEDAEDAMISVEMEALTTGNGAAGAAVIGGVTTQLAGSREQLMADSRQIMSVRAYKLSALSDAREMLQLAKKKIKSSKAAEAEFQKLYALCAGSAELDRKKAQEFIRKIEFFLAYVNRETEHDLN